MSEKFKDLNYIIPGKVNSKNYIGIDEGKDEGAKIVSYSTPKGPEIPLFRVLRENDGLRIKMNKSINNYMKSFDDRPLDDPDRETEEQIKEEKEFLAKAYKKKLKRELKLKETECRELYRRIDQLEKELNTVKHHLHGYVVNDGFESVEYYLEIEIQRIGLINKNKKKRKSSIGTFYSVKQSHEDID